jgi:integrase/recombinase XerD
MHRPAQARLTASEPGWVLSAALRLFDNGRVAAARKAELGNSSLGNSGVIQEYLVYLRVEKGLRPLSCEAYERDLLQFAEFLEGESATMLDGNRALVAGFLKHLAKHGVESRSAARKLSCLRGFYRWLLLDKRIHRDPTLNLESPSTWKVLPKSLAVAEVNSMLDRAATAAELPQADATALRDRAILELLYAAGLRVSELTGLNVADLSLEAGRWCAARETKSGLFRWGARRSSRSKSI